MRQQRQSVYAISHRAFISAAAEALSGAGWLMKSALHASEPRLSAVMALCFCWLVGLMQSSESSFASCSQESAF